MGLIWNPAAFVRGGLSLARCHARSDPPLLPPPQRTLHWWVSASLTGGLGAQRAPDTHATWCRGTEPRAQDAPCDASCPQEDSEASERWAPAIPRSHAREALHLDRAVAVCARTHRESSPQRRLDCEVLACNNIPRLMVSRVWCVSSFIALSARAERNASLE
jgi:hypothetical protein